MEARCCHLKLIVGLLGDGVRSLTVMTSPLSSGTTNLELGFCFGDKSFGSERKKKKAPL